MSHLLLPHPTWAGAGQATLALLVAWWAWQFTTWMTNELDPDAIPVRLLLLALTLASFLMAIAIPEAFGDKGLLFAGAYVTTQVGRMAFLTYVAADRGSPERARARQILVWFCASGVLWLAGGAADDTLRVGLWIAALAVDYLAPMLLFWVPGRRVTAAAWEVASSHFAERFGLFYS